MGFFYLFLSFIILYSLPKNFHFFILSSSIFLLIVIRLSLISGVCGIFLWLVLMELLEFESTLIITNLFFKRLLYLLLGLDIGYIILDTSFVWKIDHYSIVFIDVNVQNIIVGTFSLFIIELVIFFVQRIKLFKSLDLYPVNNQPFQQKFIEFYIIPLIVAFITGLLYIFNDIGNSNFGWLLISIPAEILFSFLIFEIPLLFLTTEEPIILLILSNSGTTLYSKKFNSIIKRLNVPTIIFWTLTSINTIL